MDSKKEKVWKNDGALWFQEVLDHLLYMIPVLIFNPPKRFIHGKISVEHIKENFFCLPFGHMIISHNVRDTLRFLHLIQLP